MRKTITALIPFIAVSLYLCSTTTAELYNKTYDGDHVVYDPANGTYWYPLMTHMLQMTKTQQQEYIDQLNAEGYGTITNWRLANLEQMKALALSVSAGAPQIMGGDTFDEGPMQFVGVHLDDYFEYTQHIDGLGGFPEHYLTMGRTADEEGVLIQVDGEYPGDPVLDPNGNPVAGMYYSVIPTQGQYHFPQLQNPETGELEILMFDGDLNFVADDATTSPMMGMDQECSAWVVSTDGPNLGPLENQIHGGGDRVVYDPTNDVYWYPLMTNTIGMTKEQQLAFIDQLNAEAYSTITDWKLANLEQMKNLMESMTGQSLIPDQVNNAICDPSQWFEVTDPNRNCTMGRTIDEWAKREDPATEEPWLPTVHESVYGQGEYHWFVFPDGMYGPDGTLMFPAGSIIFDDDLNFIADDDLAGPSPHRPGFAPETPYIECGAWIISENGPRRGDLENQYYNGQRIVYDPVNELFWYPILTDTVDMTRAEQEAFIDGLNAAGYARVSDWMMATYDQVEALKDALAGMGTERNEYEWPWTPPGSPRHIGSPFLAWPIQVDQFFTPTDEGNLPPQVFDGALAQTFNGRTAGWGWRNDGTAGQPDDVDWREGEADDHFGVFGYKTPGEFATMIFNYDQHYLPDDATVSLAVGGPVGAWIVSKEGPDRTPLENQTYNGQRVVYDPYNGLYWYPTLTDTLDMTRTEQEAFIEGLNEYGYGDIYGWKMATSEQTQHLKDSLAAMGKKCIAHAWPWVPEGAQRDMGSPFLAWSVRPDEFFTPTSVMEQPLPMIPMPILGGETMQVFNARTTGQWWRTDVATTPYDWQDGEADDHFVVSAFKTPGEFATMTFNYDVHYLADDATTRDEFPGPFGAWIVSEAPPEQRGGLQNQWYAGDRVVYDMVNDVYFYPLMTKMLGMTKDQQQAFITGLNTSAYATITDWKFANLQQMMALGMSASRDAQQLMGTTVYEGPVQYAPVCLDRYFEYTEYLPSAGPFPEHYLTMGRTAWEDEAVPVEMPSGAINWVRSGGQYHFPQLHNPTTGKLEILMFDNDLNYVADDVTTSLMLGRHMQCSAWVVSKRGPN